MVSFFYFHHDPWGDDPIWLIYFKWVQTWNHQLDFCLVHFGRLSVDDIVVFLGMCMLKDLLTDVIQRCIVWVWFYCEHDPLRNIAPENQWLEDGVFWEGPIFWDVLVSFRECIFSEMVIPLDDWPPSLRSFQLFQVPMLDLWMLDKVLL